MSEINEYIQKINKEFVEVVGGSFIRVDTYEMFTATEVKKYVQKKMELFNQKNVAYSKKESLAAFGIAPDQELKNRRSKIKHTNNKSRHDGGEFNIVYRGELEGVLNMKLELNEKLVYYVLRDFIAYPSNCIMINEQIPTFEELEHIVGLKERTIRKVVKSLEEKGLIKLVQSGHRKAIYVNPAYYASGKDLYIETLEMFGLVDCDNLKIESYLVD